MCKLDNHAVYVADLAKATKFLPTRFVKEVHHRLPDKSIVRIKNARAGLVQDNEILSVLREISERERQRREENALNQLVAVRSGR